MCRMLGVPFELRSPNGLIGADAETKQAPFLRLNPLGQARRECAPHFAHFALAAALSTDARSWRRRARTRSWCSTRARALHARAAQRAAPHFARMRPRS
jgi:hypothetical protein